MKSKILNFLVFITGLAISSVAAYYSIIGLSTLFSGAFWPVVIMGSVLEVGKLVAVSWLYHNWNYSPKLIRAYLSGAVVVLMFITSMGIFGFLSKAHIDQQLILNTGISEEIAILDNDIQVKQDAISDIDKQIAVIDNSINEMISRGQATKGLSASVKQKENRKELTTQKESIVKELAALKKEKIKYDAEYKKIEAEVGPIKYVAELIYGETDQNVLDKAVRLVIIILIFVFDPLAVLLLLAFNISINRKDYDELEFLDLRKYTNGNDDAPVGSMDSTR